jgi:uncharacterized protein YprB with RNaseH-like and TPR domain
MDIQNFSEKLKALGVATGAVNIQKQKPSKIRPPLEQILKGEFVENRFGRIFSLETKCSLPPNEFHTKPNVQSNALRNLIKSTGYDPGKPINIEDCVFIDIETTSLSRSAATLAFVIGAGKIRGSELQILQFFLHDPAEEIAQLYALEKFITDSNIVVSFNGKTFDTNIINNRFTQYGIKSPLINFIHLDLLQFARRLWKVRLSSKSLKNIETKILGIQRSDDDIPGWLVSQVYSDFLFYGDTSRLSNVIYHNMMDIHSLVELCIYALKLFCNPTDPEMVEGSEYFALAGIYEHNISTEVAKVLYQKGLSNEFSENEYIKGLNNLALLFKRTNKFSEATHLWKEAARLNNLSAHIELAKYFEHHERDFHQALFWTTKAINSLNGIQITKFEKHRWEIELEKRQNRILKLTAKNKENDHGK